MKISKYTIKDLTKIESCGVLVYTHKQFKSIPRVWEMYYFKDDKIRICFGVNYSVHVLINNEIPNHDEICEKVLKILNETFKGS